MKGPDNEAIYSVVCSSDILEQHSVCDIFSKFGFYRQFDLLQYRNYVIYLRHNNNNNNNNTNNILYLDTISREETLFKGVYIGTIIGYTN